MEQSDNMLIATLREYIPVPEHVLTLKDIRAQEVFSISLGVLSTLHFDVQEIKSLSGKAQRFRSMAKLNQGLVQQLQTQFQLNQLMNPSIPFLRKFLLSLINKLGSGDNVQKNKVSNKKQNINKPREGKVQLKSWLNEEWIHPALGQRRYKYKGYVLPLTINKNLLKNNVNLSSELNNSLLNGNVDTILNSTLAKHNQRVKQFQANQGISRKQQEQAAIRLLNIIKANKDDWEITDNKLNKLKKKIIQDNNDSSIIAAPQVNSVFNLELQQAEMEAEQKKSVQEVQPKQQIKTTLLQNIQNLNPFELLIREADHKRQNHQIQLKDILNQLKLRKQAIQEWQKQKITVESKTIADQQKIVKMKQETIDLKKKVEKRQTILNTLEGQKDVEEEVKKLDGQIKMIENQVKEEVDKIQGQVKSMQIESKQKMQALTDLKNKLTKIQTDYQRICQEIIDKQEMKGGVKIMTSGISRLYYHKKISQMESRWRQTEKQTKKLKNSLNQLREKTRISGTLNLRMQTQIQNILNMEKTKNQPQNKLLRQLMAKCKETFQGTLKTLEQVNEVKMQTQQFQMKVHTLSGKNYRQNIDKITFAMQDLRKQIQQLSKSRQK